MSLTKILLQERKNYAPLYHFTSYGKLEIILRQNTLKATRETDDGMNKISLTRNHKLEGFGDCRIAVDGEKLSDSFQINPFMYQGKGYAGEKDDPEFARKRYGKEREERVKGTIRNIKDYIIQVDIKLENFGSSFSKSKAKRIRKQLAQENPDVDINIVEHWRPVKKRV